MTQNRKRYKNIEEAKSYLCRKMVDLEQNGYSVLVLYSLFKNAGIRRQESVAILSLLNDEDVDTILIQIVELMDNNGWILPTEQELMDIMWPILKAKGASDQSDDVKVNPSKSFDK